MRPRLMQIEETTVAIRIFEVVIPKAIEHANNRWNADPLSNFGTGRNRKIKPNIMPTPEISEISCLFLKATPDSIAALLNKTNEMPLRITPLCAIRSGNHAMFSNLIY